jgi:hypothetical protein
MTPRQRARLSSVLCGRCGHRLVGPLHEPACQCPGSVTRRPTVELLLRTWRTDRRPLHVRALLVLRHPGALDALSGDT